MCEYLNMSNNNTARPNNISLNQTSNENLDAMIDAAIERNPDVITSRLDELFAERSWRIRHAP